VYLIWWFTLPLSVCAVCLVPNFSTHCLINGTNCFSVWLMPEGGARKVRGSVARWFC
jgi:hypothetical protein